jgi:hypothetical protein
VGIGDRNRLKQGQKMLLPFVPQSLPRKKRRRKRAGETPPTPPANVVSIARVIKDGDLGVIQFDSHIITAIGSLSGFDLDAGAGFDGVEMVDWGDDYVLFSAAVPVALGMPWRVLGQLPIIWDNDPNVVLAVPENGTVVEP